MDLHEVEKRFQQLKDNLDAGMPDLEELETEVRKVYVLPYWY